ncbi:Uncharacterised protein [uncultured archaeon]|nr:Uncharacterised protein [uncultured archaeon]
MQTGEKMKKKTKPKCLKCNKEIMSLDDMWLAQAIFPRDGMFELYHQRCAPRFGFTPFVARARYRGSFRWAKKGTQAMSYLTVILGLIIAIGGSWPLLQSGITGIILAFVWWTVVIMVGIIIYGQNCMVSDQLKFIESAYR